MTKVYCFQTHNDQTDEFDYIVIAESFKTVKQAFDKQVENLKEIGVTFIELEEAKYDEEHDEYLGYFRVENADGTQTRGMICDYHTFD